MQRRSWQRVLANTGGTLALLAVPAMALAWFTPSAWSALAARDAQVQTDGPQTSAAADVAVLTDWTETAVKPLTNAQLTTIAHKESASLVSTYKKLSMQLGSLSGPDLALRQALLQQIEALVKAETLAWNRTWFRVGRPHANPALINNALFKLNHEFILANNQLSGLIGQQIVSGSPSSYTPPKF